MYFQLINKNILCMRAKDALVSVQACVVIAEKRHSVACIFWTCKLHSITKTVNKIIYNTYKTIVYWCTIQLNNNDNITLSLNCALKKRGLTCELIVPTQLIVTSLWNIGQPS